MHAHTPCECMMPVEVKEGMGFSSIGVTDGCELPRRVWALNLGPLPEYML